MANWKADVWMGSAAGEQTVTVQSNTFHGARELIKKIYGPGVDDRDIRNLNEYRERSSSYSSGGDTLGGTVAEAVVTAPFKVVGWGFNGLKNLAEEAEIEAEKEKKAAFKAGGEKLAKWKEEQAKSEKTASRVLRYGGGFVGCAILSGLVEGLAGPLSLVFWGYIGYRAYKQHQVKKEEAQAKKNRPAQVSHKYRTEAFK